MRAALPTGATKRRAPTGTFQRSYGQLNPAQRRAVDTIEGPVMVIAGPGTGKTEVVALRVANILRRTQMRPGNILCLTFSTSGAKAMRERLRGIIGPDAYGVTVETVHGFCNEIILQHPHVFGEFRALEQVSEIERLRSIRSLMKELGPGSVLGKPTVEQNPSPLRSAAASRAATVLHRIGEMKREGVSTNDLELLIPAYRSGIETTENGKERNRLTQAYKDDIRLVQQFEEFITLYRGYNDALYKSHRYDYEDMVLVAGDALLKHDWLLASLQERYQYILVDEFQDLNGAQNRVIETLTTEPAPEHPPNLFVVGDDDQAIYRFQGASPANMLSFLERFPKAEVITLTGNYRSTQEILDAASAVIANNEERLAGKVDGIKKTLQSNQKSKTPAPQRVRGAAKNQKPEFLRYPAIENERAGIVGILRQAHESGIPWTEMAVLTRRNEELEPLYDAFLAAGIPTILTAKQDMLLHPEIRQAIVILKAIEHINSDAALSAALGCPTLGMHPADLGRVWVRLRKRNRRRTPDEPHTTLRELLQEDNPQFSILNSLPAEALPPDHRLDEEWAKAGPFSIIESLHVQKDSLTLPALVERALKDSGLLPGKNAKNADPRVIAGLHAFYDYVKDRTYENKALTLPQLLQDLDQYLTERHLKLEYAVPHLVSDGVNLMTAHGAKGLEFELVVIAHVRHRNWGNTWKGSLLSLPDHLIFRTDSNVEQRLKQEDERRLFYVGMTRAKRRLFLTFPETYRSGDEMKNAQPSSFIAEAEATLQEVNIPANEVPAPIETLRKPPLLRDEAFRAFLEERLGDFSLSVTALNAFLDDPQDFLWTHLLLMPQAKPPPFAFGSAVHAALEKRNLALQAGEPFTTADLIGAFERTMEEREVFTKTDRAHYLHVGRIVLERYGKETENDRPIIHSAERSFYARLRPSRFAKAATGKSGDRSGSGGQAMPTGRQARWHGIPLTGKVDRIDLFHREGRNCRIIDYKTGRTKRTADAVRKDGNLFRQLVFYKVLSDLSPAFTHTATLFTLDFVGNDEEGRRVIDIEIGEKESSELKELIEAVWSKIVALDFSPL